MNSFAREVPEASTGPAATQTGPEPETPAAATSRRPKIWQLSLRTLLLFAAAVAAWTMVARQDSEITSLRERIDELQVFARTLVVRDFTQLAAVKLEETWYDDNSWEVFVPERSRGPFRLCLATRGIATNSDVPGADVAVAEALLPEGTHVLRIEPVRVGEAWRIDVLVDGQVVISREETADWVDAANWTTLGSLMKSEQSPADRRFVLFRRRHNVRFPDGSSRMPDGVGSGLLLWIEPGEK